MDSIHVQKKTAQEGFEPRALSLCAHSHRNDIDLVWDWPTIP